MIELHKKYYEELESKVAFSSYNKAKDSNWIERKYAKKSEWKKWFVKYDQIK